MTKLKLIPIPMLGLAAIAAGVWTCGGGVTPAMDTRESARDKATVASCEYYRRCDLIGPGKDTMGGFATLESCDLNARAFWDNAWPATQCSMIDQAGLSVCINAINGTLCMNGADVLATLLIKCPAAMVCVAPADAGDQS